MLCLSGFELYSCWVPLTNVLKEPSWDKESFKQMTETNPPCLKRLLPFYIDLRLNIRWTI